MPRGIYPRVMTPARRASIAKNFAKGRLPEARAKATAKLKENASDFSWREKVSEATKKAMHRPEVREKHLAGLKRNRKKLGNTFKGGNGKEPTKFVKQVAKILEPLGFVREFCIPTKGHKTQHKPPTSYKVDFGHSKYKKAIELDGVASHHTIESAKKDKKKQEVLESLGWIVYRIKHK